MNATGEIVGLKLPALFEAMAKLQVEIGAMVRAYEIAIHDPRESAEATRRRVELLARIGARHCTLRLGRQLLGLAGVEMGLWCDSAILRAQVKNQTVPRAALRDWFPPLEAKTFKAN